MGFLLYNLIVKKKVSGQIIVIKKVFFFINILDFYSLKGPYKRSLGGIRIFVYCGVRLLPCIPGGEEEFKLRGSN